MDAQHNYLSTGSNLVNQVKGHQLDDAKYFIPYIKPLLNPTSTNKRSILKKLRSSFHINALFKNKAFKKHLTLFKSTHQYLSFIHQQQSISEVQCEMLYLLADRWYVFLKDTPDYLLLIAKQYSNKDNIRFFLLVSVICAQVALKLNFKSIFVKNLILSAWLYKWGVGQTSNKIMQGVEQDLLSKQLNQKLLKQTLTKIEKTKGIHALTKKTVRYSNERLDGSGFPNGIAGKFIPIASQILGLVHDFCSMTEIENHPNRLNITDAYHLFHHQLCSVYSQHWIKQLINTLGPYPTGTKVQLNDQKIAIVIGQMTNQQLPFISVSNFLNWLRSPQRFSEPVHKSNHP